MAQTQEQTSASVTVPAQNQAPSQTPGSALTQVSAVLGGILLFILLLAWLAKKFGVAPQARNNQMMKVVSSCPVGQREKVVIVEVDDTWLVLGVTAQQVTPLHTLPAKAIDVAQDNSADFRKLLSKVMNRSEKSE
ncbi:flagellar biosynthetic protein FliO [Lonsdalea populi]|uniref:flagellar biosynthetic protein FliO n=1 Tax=Lonsdalea populi TaxID=1172565 RepID=UPI000A24CFF2|nr:flagellar biosynthetic protein FliO [Lonsdalea populi]OSM94574.1 flagellar assembly protein FliO [Lonsdalea populi]RAT68742.1 flagellar assembly protein FliO [Lonsdalea populi]RAT70551.1 flagellar assembly protein FliO [Lonsdalea populi]RAT72174.1 flagellar assembly protein FliO [Lonsdalea populi]RAT75500.1 flagellar assembly protein FliO [Lonsdalea populi]